MIRRGDSAPRGGIRHVPEKANSFYDDVMHLPMGGYLVIDSPSERIFSGGAQMNYTLT